MLGFAINSFSKVCWIPVRKGKETICIALDSCIYLWCKTCFYIPMCPELSHCSLDSRCHIPCLHKGKLDLLAHINTLVRPFHLGHDLHCCPMQETYIAHKVGVQPLSEGCWVYCSRSCGSMSTWSNGVIRRSILVGSDFRQWLHSFAEWLLPFPIVRLSCMKTPSSWYYRVHWALVGH
jgi:hypothetical protein